MDKTFISLFGGIGSFDLAFQRQGWKGVYYNDWDKYAVKTYNKNFGTNYEPTDITTINPRDIPEHSLICAGFPCQSFSIAGKRGGFSDTRGTMFFEIMRVAKYCRTPYLLLENVKGLLSHDKGWTFATILNTLDELGYDAQWQVLNSKFFGVPQNRERVFIIANLRSQPRPEVFPLTQNAGTIPEILSREGDEEVSVFDQQNERFRDDGNIGTLCGEGLKRGNRGFLIGKKKDDVIVYDRKGFDSRTKGFRESLEVPTLSVKMGTGGNNVPMVVSLAGDRDKPSLTIKDEVGTIPANPMSDRQPMIMDFRKDEGFRERDKVSPALTSHGSSQGGIPVPMVISHSPRSGNPKLGGTGVLASEEHAFTLDSTPHIVAQRGRESGQQFESNEESNSLTNVSKDNYVFQNQLRRLTPVECARLQGFPDNWHIGMSDTQAYKQYGNAITVNVVEEIAKRLNEWIKT